jgi:hypothetical protein
MDLGLIKAWGILLVFGLIYNTFVGWLERKGLIEGYLGILVIVGVAVTLLVSGPFIGWDNFKLMVSFFAASGLFMALGDIGRFLKLKREGQEFWRRLHGEAHREGQHDRAKSGGPGV